MEENPFIFQEKVKNAFSRIKEENLIVKRDIESLKDDISIIKVEISSINHKIAEIMDILLKIADKKGFPQEEISTGNEGVFRPFDAHSTPIRRPFDDQKGENDNNLSIKNIEKLKDVIDDQYRLLTNKEFLVFTALYHLQEELNTAVTYPQIAERLKVSPSSIKFHINSLILKRVPITKVKSGNGNMMVSIPDKFRSLKMLGKIDKIRRFDFNQKTLFDD
jgi:hypothetical protein